MNKRSLISIVIPSFNEERLIKKNLIELMDFLKNKNCDWEIIVVDDGSKDKTKKIVHSLQKNEPGLRLYSNRENMGKGASVRKGVQKASGDFIFFLDADLATPVSEIEKFIPLIRNYDIVIGNRAHKKARISVREPLHREFMGKFFTFLSNVLLLKNIHDVTCGFKCFRRDVAKRIFKKQKINRWVFDTEILFLAQKYRYKIKQEPVSWAHEKDSKVSLIKDTFGSFRDLLVIKFGDILGKYD